MLEKDEVHELSVYSHRVRFRFKVFPLVFFLQLKEDLFHVSLRLCPLNRHDEIGYNESIMDFGFQMEHNHLVNTNIQFELFPFAGGSQQYYYMACEGAS